MGHFEDAARENNCIDCVSAQRDQVLYRLFQGSCSCSCSCSCLVELGRRNVVVDLFKRSDFAVAHPPLKLLRDKRGGAENGKGLGLWLR